MIEFLVSTEDEMFKLGERLGRYLATGDLLFLFGELGAGKTTFTKGVAAGMGIAEPITSPTFQLKKTYDGKLTLNHLDLYRLGSACELDIIEPNELIEEGVAVVEWGKLLIDRLQTDYLEIIIEVEIETSWRKVTFVPHGSRYVGLLEDVDNAGFRD